MEAGAVGAVATWFHQAARDGDNLAVAGTLCSRCSAWPAPVAITCWTGVALALPLAGASLWAPPLKSADCACSAPWVGVAGLVPPPLVHAQDDETAPSASLQSNLGVRGAHWRWHAADAASQAPAAAEGAAAAGRRPAARRLPACCSVPCLLFVRECETTVRQHAREQVNATGLPKAAAQPGEAAFQRISVALSVHS